MEHQYLSLLQDILSCGTARTDRTGVGTRAVFGRQLRFNLQQGFPLLTTKKVHFKSVVHELLWFLQGSTNVAYLQQHGVKIWNEWADANGELGPIYGKQWRSWPTPDGQHIDQLTQLLDALRQDPYSRRHIISAWNVGELAQMALPPCHLLFQFFIADGHLSCQWYQRSCDSFLGLPFNIASYALLTYMIAAQLNLQPGELIFTGGDVHLYDNHIEQAKEQLTRSPKAFPRLRLAECDHLFDYGYEDIELIDYHPHSAIKAPIAV